MCIQILITFGMLRLKFTPNPYFDLRLGLFFEEAFICKAHSGWCPVLAARCVCVMLHTFASLGVPHHPPPTLTPLGLATQDFRVASGIREMWGVSRTVFSFNDSTHNNSPVSDHTFWKGVAKINSYAMLRRNQKPIITGQQKVIVISYISLVNNENSGRKWCETYK